MEAHAEMGASGSPTVVNGVVYVCSDYDLYALNANTEHDILGLSSVSLHLAVPAVVNGVVYVTGWDGVFAVDANTGTLLWKFWKGGQEPVNVANGLVYTIADALYALDAGTGEVIWKYADLYAAKSPAIANGVAYISGCPGTSALNARTGALIWKTEEGWCANLAVTDGMLYLSQQDAIIALNASTGAHVWSYPARDAGVRQRWPTACSTPAA